jgi:hypothetical protein
MLIKGDNKTLIFYKDKSNFTIMNAYLLIITFNMHKYLQYIFYIFFDVWKLLYLHNYVHILYI